MKAPATIKTPAQYIAALPPDRREAVQTLHALIREAAPTLKPYLQSGMIGYGEYHYQYASGREGDWFRVGLASQKNHLSLYFCASTPEGYLAELHQARLGRVSVGRSCVRFKKLADLNLDTVRELLALTLTSEGEPTP